MEDGPRFDEDEVDIDEGEHLFLNSLLGGFPKGVPMAHNDGSIFTCDDIERNEGENGFVDLVDGSIRVSDDEWSYANLICGKFVESNFLVEGDGPTVVRKGDEASNWVMEPHANNDTLDLGLYVKNDLFNKIGLVDCGPQDQMGRKDYEGPTNSSLDVLNSLLSKIATT